MQGLVSLLPALVAAASLTAGATATPAHAAPVRTVAASAATPADEATPLEVTMDSLTPSTLPRKGKVRVSGSVTNLSDETWTDINLYAFASSTPMTSSAELAAAADTPTDAVVGERILDDGTYDSVDSLAPGESRSYSFAVPRSAIGVSEPGVYWFGVHALGTSPAGFDLYADGRARTFLPLVPPTSRSVDTALVLPLRHLVAHVADGSLARVRGWKRDLSAGGPLHAIVELGTAGGSRTVSWLVDPAVVDAARRLAAGNPPRYLGPTVDDGEGDGDQDGGESASPSPSPAADTAEAEEPSRLRVRTTEAAAAWLDRLREGLTGNEVLALPYGDVDVAAAAAHDPAAYRQARRRADGPLQPWGLPTTPAVSSPSGYLDPAGIRLSGAGTTVLLSDRMLGAPAPAVVTTAGHTVAVTSSGAVAGGPGPGDRMTPVAERQRIVSEAAVRLLAPGDQPLIAVLPSTWTPEASATFWAGLDLPWLNLTSVSTAMEQAGAAPEVPADRLDYPPAQQALEVDAAAFAASDELARSGEALQNLLSQNDTVAAEVHDEAWTDVSYSTRAVPEAALASASASRAWIQGRLRSVQIDAPKAVILSSGSGKFAATVTNDLDQPVSVRVRAVSEPPLRVTVPDQTIALGPESRTTVLLQAASSAVGIRNVTLLLTDVDDVPLGSSDDVPIRSNRVSNVIWLIVGTGVALLFGAIVVRLLRRFRASRRAA